MTAVLVVDDEPVIRNALVDRLDEEGFDAVPAESLAQARAELASRKIDAILLDIRLRDGDGLDLLDELRRAKQTVPVIVATAFGDSERAIRAMRLGAFEYVTKPFDLDALLRAIARAVETPAARGPDPEVRGMIGSSPKMLDVWKSIGRAAASDVPVLVTGETGVGKELVAHAIHEHGDRRAKPFVAVNLAALPPALLESELFGHERGAFTGAAARREGRFELAADGTLFLDEIADLDPLLQTKLLRVLEDRRFERVGGSEQLETRARIVSATSRPTSTMREDLYYRLGVLRIDVPPLRERRQDIPALVQAFLAMAAPPRRAISEAALDRLVEYHWPGNVRELRHVIQHACVMSAAEVLSPEDFALRAAPIEPIHAAPPRDLDLKAALDRLERSMIEEALARAKGNRAETARLLGIRRALLYARLRYFGLA
ncbi:MAG TPA: sigma-54 dependent transcriptional regulator [Kofleriaceae bacterium]|nr:sigma-54 dependent transcriptional regulator [Kofleriaceae bacterium]